jgi:multiple sugar transport system ATP-binding protein
MRHGVLQQADRPQALYERPANLFVAGFIGSPGMNLVEADLVETNGELAVRFGPHQLAVSPTVAAERPRLRSAVGRTVAVGIRPEDMSLATGEAPAGRTLEVTVDIREDMGSELFVHFAVDASPVASEEVRDVVGDEALAAADEQTHHHGSPFVARIARGADVREGEAARLVVATERLHFFEIATGEAI